MEDSEDAKNSRNETIILVLLVIGFSVISLTSHDFSAEYQTVRQTVKVRINFTAPNQLPVHNKAFQENLKPSYLDSAIIPENKNQKSRINTLNQFCQKYKTQNPEIQADYNKIGKLYYRDKNHYNKSCPNNHCAMKNSFLYCFSLKSGTTNWQRAILQNSMPKVEPYQLEEPDIYILSKNLANSVKNETYRTENILKSRENDKILRGINVRHPFVRLHSAWHQKFNKEYIKFAAFGN